MNLKGGLLAILGLVTFLAVICFTAHCWVDWHESNNEIIRLTRIAEDLILQQQTTGQWPETTAQGDRQDFWNQPYQLVKTQSQRLDSQPNMLLAGIRNGDDIVVTIRQEGQGFVPKKLGR